MTGLVCVTGSVGDTRAMAAAVSGLTVEGDILVLTGDLGAGKTAFVQGFAAGLGIGCVTSPTFTLANRYVGGLVINHLDVYRLDSIAEVEALAIPELVDDGVMLVEWGDRILPALPEDRLEIRIEFGAGDDDRCFKITFPGRSWQARRDELSEALQGWSRSC